MLSREVRRVPKDWVHPKKEDVKVGGSNEFKPLANNYIEAAHNYMTKKAIFSAYEMTAEALVSQFPDLTQNFHINRFEDIEPDIDDYMPIWSPAFADHYMMYEIVTEGRPISPAFKTPEELAQYLVDSKKSVGYNNSMGTSTYEQWLRFCTGNLLPEDHDTGLGHPGWI